MDPFQHAWIGFEPDEREAGGEADLAGVLAEGHHTCKEGHRHRGNEKHHTS